MALLSKTSYGALEQTAASEGIQAQAATSVLQLKGEVEKTLAAANLEATFETFYLSDGPNTLQKRRQNRAKVVVSFTKAGSRAIRARRASNLPPPLQNQRPKRPAQPSPAAQKAHAAPRETHWRPWSGHWRSLAGFFFFFLPTPEPGHWLG